MRPGITKTGTVTDAWVRVTTLYGSPFTTKIVEDNETAAGVFISITTNTVQVGFGDSAPAFAGHPMIDGDSLKFEHPTAISRMWLKNNVAGSAGVAVITPLLNM